MIKTDRQLIQSLIDSVQQRRSRPADPQVHATMLLEYVFDYKPVFQPHNRKLALEHDPRRHT
jgi:hypothetical protein